MLFRDLDGNLRLALHQPNEVPNERMRLFMVEDDGERLSVTRKKANQ